MSAISQTAISQYCFLWSNFRGFTRQIHGTQHRARFISGLSFLPHISPRWCSRPCTWNVTNQTLLLSTPWNFEATDPAPNQKRGKMGKGVQKIMIFAKHVRYLSRKCYSQLISIDRTQVVWFSAQNTMHPPGEVPLTQQKNYNYGTTYSATMCRISLRCFYPQKMLCFFSKLPGIVPLERPLHRVVALVLHIGLDLVPFMRDALSSRVIPFLLGDTFWTFRSIQIPRLMRLHESQQNYHPK